MIRLVAPDGTFIDCPLDGWEEDDAPFHVFEGDPFPPDDWCPEFSEDLDAPEGRIGATDE